MGGGGESSFLVGIHGSFLSDVDSCFLVGEDGSFVGLGFSVDSDDELSFPTVESSFLEGNDDESFFSGMNDACFFSNIGSSFLAGSCDETFFPGLTGRSDGYVIHSFFLLGDEDGIFFFSRAGSGSFLGNGVGDGACSPILVDKSFCFGGGGDGELFFFDINGIDAIVFSQADSLFFTGDDGVPCFPNVDSDFILDGGAFSFLGKFCS